MLPFSCPFQLSSSIEFRRVFGSRSEGKLIASIAQIVLHEGDQPDPVPDLRHADILAREGVAEIDLPALKNKSACTESRSWSCRGTGR